MRIWILTSSINMGGMELARNIEGRFASAVGNNEVRLIDASAPDFPYLQFEHGGSPDILLVLNALEFYMANRFSIPGSPWICAASFCYADLYTLYRGSVKLNETGINAILTNCAPYVEHASSVVPTKLCYSPVLHEPHKVRVESGAQTIGTLLPNVQDRDFSFLCWVHEKLKQRGVEDRFVIFKNPNSDDTYKLPGDLKITEVLSKGWSKLPDIFIPVPRITDYRAGVLPPELIQAWFSACRPIVPFHPNIAPLKLGLYSSLTEIERELDKFAADEELDPLDAPEKQFCPSVYDFVEEVMQARERWNRDRVTV